MDTKPADTKPMVQPAFLTALAEKEEAVRHDGVKASLKALLFWLCFVGYSWLYSVNACGMDRVWGACSVFFFILTLREFWCMLDALVNLGRVGAAKDLLASGEV